MKHSPLRLYLVAIVLLVLCKTYAQAPTLSYLNVHTQMIYNGNIAALILDADSMHIIEDNLSDADSLETTALFSIEAPLWSDSLQIILMNSKGIIVYHTTKTLSVWQQEAPYRFDDGVLYFSINIGRYAYMRHFKAEATISGSGHISSLTFTKD